jgi:NADH:ubiquinone oxidoreductase subunit 6 (subunit J)
MEADARTLFRVLAVSPIVLLVSVSVSVVPMVGTVFAKEPNDANIGAEAISNVFRHPFTWRFALSCLVQPRL